MKFSHWKFSIQAAEFVPIGVLFDMWAHHVPFNPQDLFKNAVALGMAASPFTTTSVTPLIFIRKGVRTPLVGCNIEYHCDSAPLEETGIQPGHKLSVQIPKRLVPAKPNHVLDALEYQGRVYKFAPVEGGEDFSPLWALEAQSPLS